MTMQLTQDATTLRRQTGAAAWRGLIANLRIAQQGMRGRTRSAAAAIAAWRRRRKARRVLLQLDDRTLADIGLMRGEIECILREDRPFRS